MLNALYTIEQLVLTTFKKVLAVAKLIHSMGWHWLQCSYGKCVCAHCLMQAGANTTLSESACALHVACHAVQPHRRADADAEMHAAFEGVLEGGMFDADRMHFSHSLMCQGFTAAVQAQGSDDTSDMGQFINCINTEAYMAMRDVDWRDYLFGPEHDVVMITYNKEWTSLKETGVLVELDPTHPEYKVALSFATSGRCLLEFKQVGMWKCRVVVRRCCENKVFLDSAGFDYAANVCELVSIRNLLFAPCSNPYVSGDSGADTTEASNTDTDPIVIAQIDAATAYLQSEMYSPNELK